MASQQSVDSIPSVDAITIDSAESESSAAKPQKELEGCGGNSMKLTAGILVADVVGAGILGMPVAVAKFGWALGSIVLIVMLIANVHMSILMWRVRMVVPETHTYHDLVMASFASAPSWQKGGAVLIGTVPQLGFIFSMLGMYLLSIGEGLGMLFYDIQICLPWWALAACCLLLPIVSTSTEMGKYKSLIWINVLALVMTVFIPLIYLALSGDHADKGGVYSFPSSPTLPSIMSGLSTFSFALSSQFLVPEIISEMRDPKEFPKAYALLSAPFQLIAFLVAGVGGYCIIGDEVSGMINENIPFGVSFRIASLCMVVHMLISYIIKGVVFAKFLQRVVDSESAACADKKKSMRSMISWALCATFTMITAYMLANLVPFFNDAVDLLGASFTPLSCWVMPIAMFFRVYKDSPDLARVSKAEWLVMGLELAMAFVVMVWGTASAVQAIMAHWETYGYPFACHCQGLWDTCACSAHHPGMEFCNIINTTSVGL